MGETASVVHTVISIAPNKNYVTIQRAKTRNKQTKKTILNIWQAYNEKCTLHLNTVEPPIKDTPKDNNNNNNNNNTNTFYVYLIIKSQDHFFEMETFYILPSW